MNSSLLIRMASDGALTWRAADGTRGTGTPPSARMTAASPVTVLVPGEDVLLTRVELPPVSPGRLAQVLPYALEDQLLDEVESLHFAAGPRGEDGRHAVAVVARARMQAWRQALDRAGIAADVMLPDALAVPLDEGSPAAMIEGERCLLRDAPALAAVVDTAQLAAWLGEPASLQVWTVAGESNVLPQGGERWQVAPPRDALEILARGLETDSGLNLLGGDYAARHRRAPRRRLWRRAAMLAVAAILIGLLTQVAAVVRLHAANSEAEAALDRRYASLFPDSPPVPDPVARVRSELARLGGGSDAPGLLGMLSAAAPILASHDFRLAVQGMDYRNDTLELSVRARSLANLDQLRERLATLPGIRVELTAATPDADGVEGRLSLSSGGGA